MNRPLDFQHTGQYGHAWALNLPPASEREVLAHRATLALWLLTVPVPFVAWSQYGLCMIHLRDIPGVRAPHRRFPSATHELMLFALDPKHTYTKDNILQLMKDGPVMLRPTNLVEQFELRDDAEAIQLVSLAARGIVHGLLPAEPGDWPGGKDRWQTSMLQTIDHMRGKHDN